MLAATLRSRRHLLPPCLALLAVASACVADPDESDDSAATDAASGTADGATDTQDSGASDSGGPALCDPVDPSTLVGLEVDLGDFPVEGATSDGYRFDDVFCSVTAVDLSIPSRVRTELGCISAMETSHTVVIEHAATNLGGPAWAAPDAVLLSIDLLVYSDLNDIPLWAVAMRSPEGEPLLLVMDGNRIVDSIAAPIVLSLDEDGCGPGDGEFETHGLLSLTFDGVTTMVADGNEGTLETPAGSWAVELGQAYAGDFGESSLLFDLLVMKVQ